MRIPTNVVTGFLGVGKTTAILDLLARKDAGERWAVLVNEYGEVGIDAAILAGDGVTVREVAGGCVCCATAPYLQVALHLLLTEAKPHRLIVETTGLGHPGQLIERLRSAYSDRLEIRSTITIVSPDDFTTPGMRENPVFREQVELADVLVLNKLDRTDETTVGEFQRWANELNPPKQLIAATRSGRLEPEWLDLVAHLPGLPLAMGDDGFADPPVEPRALIPGQPLRFESPADPRACGWIFCASDTFHKDEIVDYLGSLAGVARLKGLFRILDGWLLINRVGESSTVSVRDRARDSRVEIILSESTGNWERIEVGLIDCLIR